MLRKLPVAFYLGLVMLSCVVVAGVASACGSSSSTDKTCAVAKVEQHACDCCHEREGVIATLRHELAEVRRDILEARQQRIGSTIERINDRLEPAEKTKTKAVVVDKPKATAVTTQQCSGDCQTGQPRTGILRFRR